MKKFFSTTEVAEMLGISRTTLHRWETSGKLVPHRDKMFGLKVYSAESLCQFPQFQYLTEPKRSPAPKPTRQYQSVELFAGGGGLAVGLEKAGFDHLFLNEKDRDAAQTLRNNRPNWKVLEGDVSEVITDTVLEKYQGQVDLVTGGFPCQAFSFAGLKRGLEDARGTLFYEFARVVQSLQPPIAIGENVRGLLSHNDGETLEVMIGVLEKIGYKVIQPRILNAIFYQTPQLRERLFLVAIRSDLDHKLFRFPNPVDDEKPYVLSDALKKGRLYKCDVPKSTGQSYSDHKKFYLDKVPPGGYWKDLNLQDQMAYMGASYYLGGGKTGMARRMAWNEPCLTLTCSPAQKQTERCHPDETRPFTVREYARIQTFPDDWEFHGSLSSQYKQIGNAVPVNLAFHIGKAALEFLTLADNQIDTETDPVPDEHQALLFN